MTAMPDTFAAADATEMSAQVSSRRDERRHDRIAASQVRQQERDAAEKRRQQRLDDDEDRRRRRREDRDKRRADHRRDRDKRLSALAARVSEHSTDLMFIPIIAVPGWLGWDAMSGFGRAMYAGPGRTLPVLSETAMWVFDFVIVRARRKDPNAIVWPYYIGMVIAAAFCALLNFMHGLTGPIPGAVNPGVEAAVVYALISVSGIVFHQIIALGGRKRKAANKVANKKVVGPVVGHPVGPLAGSRLGRLVGRLVGQGDADLLAGRLDQAAAEAERLKRENAALRRQLANQKSGNPGSSDDDHDDRDEETETPARRGEAKSKMRAEWEKEIAAGRIPNGPALNVAAGKPVRFAQGRTYATEWRKELSPEFIERATEGQNAGSAQQESTTTGQAGE